MTGKGFLDTWLTGKYGSAKRFLSSNKTFSDDLVDKEQSGLGGRDLTGKSGLGGLFQI